MNPEYSISALLLAAASIGIVHTIIEPHHYLPFAALSKSNGWSVLRTLMYAFFCGLGHALSSVLVGMAGLALGAGLGAVEAANLARGEIVKWMFLAFAVAYTLYGLKNAFERKIHMHPDGSFHKDESCCKHKTSGASSAAFWTLFLIFALGPCEVLIPLVMPPAANSDWAGVFSVAITFSAASIITMLAMVSALLAGMKMVPTKADLSRYAGLFTGIVLCFCAAWMFLEG